MKTRAAVLRELGKTFETTDDAEETGEEHEWQRFAQRLREAGVVVTLDELRVLPYRVMLSIPEGNTRWQESDVAPFPERMHGCSSE